MRPYRPRMHSAQLKVPYHSSKYAPPTSTSDLDRHNISNLANTYDTSVLPSLVLGNINAEFYNYSLTLRLRRHRSPRSLFFSLRHSRFLLIFSKLSQLFSNQFGKTRQSTPEKEGCAVGELPSRSIQLNWRRRLLPAPLLRRDEGHLAPAAPQSSPKPNRARNSFLRLL